MKKSYYDILQIDPKANPEIIKAAYVHIKLALQKAGNEGDGEAKNQLLFLEEAYAVLSSEEKRAEYDMKNRRVSPNAPIYQTGIYADEKSCSEIDESKISGKIFLAGLFIALAFAAYKFTGQRSTQTIESRKVEIQSNNAATSARNEEYRAETERALAQGLVQNQEKTIDKSYDIASQEQERHRAELEYRKNHEDRILEMQRQHQEELRTERLRLQQQHERDRQERAAKEAAEAPKRQLCNMYELNGNTREAWDAGCYPITRNETRGKIEIHQKTKIEANRGHQPEARIERRR